MNKTRVLLLVIIFIGGSVAVLTVRQYVLNYQLLEAVQVHAGTSTIRSLINRGANPNASGGYVADSALFRAAEFGPPATVDVLLNAGASTCPVSTAHIGPIAASASASSPGMLTPSVTEYKAIFQDLRSHGANLEQRDSLGFTPLMRAVWSGNMAATQALLEMGANPRAVDNHGDTVQDWTGNMGAEQQIKINSVLCPYLSAQARSQAAD